MICLILLCLGSFVSLSACLRIMVSSFVFSWGFLCFLCFHLFLFSLKKFWFICFICLFVFKRGEGKGVWDEWVGRIWRSQTRGNLNRWYCMKNFWNKNKEHEHHFICFFKIMGWNFIKNLKFWRKVYLYYNIKYIYNMFISHSINFHLKNLGKERIKTN